MIKLFYGKEPYWLNFELNKIRGMVDDLSYCEYDMWDDSVKAIANSVNMFADRNVIVIRLEKLGANDSLMDYLQHECSMTDVYIFAESVDKNTKVYKAIAKNPDNVKECQKLSDKGLKAFVFRKLHAEGAVMTEDAYELFKKRVAYLEDEECNLFTVANYAKQLAFLSDKIEVEDVKDVVPETLTEKSFALTELLLCKQGDKLFKVAKGLLNEGENPISMLSLLLRSFRLAYKASLYPELSGKERKAKLGLTYGRFPDIKGSPENIAQAMDMLQGAVSKIKSGYPAERVFLTTLARVYQLV